MANKNLIKRAFSVTANLSASPATPTIAGEGVDLADTRPVTTANESGGSQAGTAVGSQNATGSPAPRTGPGSMLAFMTEQSEVHKEVVQLRERVAAFDGAEVVRRLDPAMVRPSRWANRESAHFSTESFAQLKSEIAGAGGNVQPIKVRAVKAAPGVPESFEIVYGHRRHRACLELGVPVLALVQNAMEDTDLFVEMERENRNRADLSAWEQGTMYLRALELGLFPSAKQLASAIDRDTGNIGRAMALAKLPSEVVAAFGSPLNLQFRWATPLKDAHQRDPEGLLEAARAIAQRESRPSPAEVFVALTQPVPAPATRSQSSVEWKDESGALIASLTRDRKGRATLCFAEPLGDAQSRRLKKLMDDFLGIKA
ncbi:MAG TPA: ParB/RepB/Spo0J family partition protein [Variovorax sp.]|nr:ParB/RepB/Spo0J family partition protein [Variovorax sp.]